MNRREKINFFTVKYPVPFLNCLFSKRAPGILLEAHLSDPVQNGKFERPSSLLQNFFRPLEDVSLKKIVYPLKRIDMLKSGGSSPALARLASVAGPAYFWGAKSPQTVDAVGFQPTASILSAKLGGR